MRILLTVLAVLASPVALAHHDFCASYTGNAREMSAIEAVADHLNYSVEDFCSLPRLIDLEAHPSQVITREGNIEPHVRVQMHYEEYTCLYMVRDADQVISSQRCFSTI